MLNRAKRPIESHCLPLSLKVARFLTNRKPRSRTPAKSIRVPVKKSGGECSRVIFPNENMLDQPAYIKITMRIDIEERISGKGQTIKKIDFKIFIACRASI